MKYEEGKFLKITCTHDNEKSFAFYEVVKDPQDGRNYLKPYSSNIFAPNGHTRQKVNAQYLAGVYVSDMDNMSFLKERLFEWYKKNNKKDFYDWRNDNVSIDVKDFTKMILKEKKEIAKKEAYKKIKEENINTKAVIENIPEDVKLNYASLKNKDLTPEEYTEKVFLMTKKLYGIEDGKRRVNDVEREVLNKLFSDYDIAKNNDADIREVFNSYVKNTNESENLKVIGNLYKKTLDKNFKGLEIRLEPNVEYEMDKTIEAIENDKYPIMLPKENVDYIINPDTNGIYRGNNQMALQRNNNMEDIDAKSYVSLDSFIKNGGTFDKKIKTCTQIINKGKNENGNYVYEIVIPCKVSKKDMNVDKKIEKSLRKEEMRRNYYDAKFNYKYGHLPVFNTKLQLIPEEQPALIKKSQIVNQSSSLSKDSDIESRIIADTSNYFVSMLTKEKYEPSTPWASPEWKEELKNFVKRNPEKIIRIANVQYQNVASQVREHDKVMQKTHAEVHQNNYEKSRGR